MSRVSRFAAFSLALVLSGCATVTTMEKKQASNVNQLYRSGNVPVAVSLIDSAYKDTGDQSSKDTLFYLEKGTMTRNLGQAKINDSTQLLLGADSVVKAWENQTRLSLDMTMDEFGKSINESFKLSQMYQPRDYEKSMLSFSIAINHALARRYDLAIVESNKMVERETIIEKFREKTFSSIKSKEGSGDGITSRVEEIQGYPVEVLNSPLLAQAKNAYQNPASYYLSGFIYESQKEPSLAAPSYNRAITLRPNNQLFRTSLANLDKNVATKSGSISETLLIIESGFLSELDTFRTTVPFKTKRGPKVVTFVLPTLKNNGSMFNPNAVQIGDQRIPLVQVSSIEAMARRDFKDQMPGHIMRATTSALVQIAVQEAIQKKIDKDKQKNNNEKKSGGKKLLAAIGTAAAAAPITAGLVDTRMWNSLPSEIYMARVRLPKGEHLIAVPTPVGVRVAKVKLSEGYEIVHARIFDNGIALNNYSRAMNDDLYGIQQPQPESIKGPNSLPIQPVKAQDQSKLGLTQKSQDTKLDDVKKNELQTPNVEVKTSSAEVVAPATEIEKKVIDAVDEGISALKSLFGGAK